MKKYAIIVAGGSGSRMGSEIPKQFLELNGKPVLMHSMNRFFNYDNSISLIVVLPENQISYWQQLCRQHEFTLPHQLTTGGSERFYSVKNGLALIDEQGCVGIHDAVRPLVSMQTIKLAFDSALQFGSGIPVVSINDSIREIDNESNFAVNRTKYKIIQTPQCFLTKTIIDAFNQPFNPAFTDDATVLESKGINVHLTQGNIENIKITTPRDLIIAKALLDFEQAV